MLSATRQNVGRFCRPSVQVLQSTRHRTRQYVVVQDKAEAQEDCDVVIVGGGPIGLALASALASSSEISESLSITLIEASDLRKVRNWSPTSGAYSNRVSSITNSSQRFLEGTGSWAHVDHTRTAPIEDMQVWDGISDSRITFSADNDWDFSNERCKEMARLVENLNLQKALLLNLEGKHHIRITDNVKVQKITPDQQEEGAWPLVHTSDGRSIRARLLIGADGPNSPVRLYTNIQSYGWAYDTQAIVATMNHAPRSVGQNTNAFQRFLPTGPIAFLPISATSSSLVWSTKPALASALVRADSSILATMINAAFRLPEVSLRYLYNVILDGYNKSMDQALTEGEVIKEIQWREQSHNIVPTSAFSVSSAMSSGIPPEDAHLLPPLVSSVQEGSVASFPLRMNHADSYLGEGSRARTVLLGDAAHTIHPLAGQGLNLGLADAECLASCIKSAVRLGVDIGSYTALQPYARARYFENHKMLAVTDKLHKLYGNAWSPVVSARSIGLEVLNELDAAKAAIMRNAGSEIEKTSHTYASGSAWDTPAKAIELLAGAADSVTWIGQGIGKLAQSRLKEILEPYAQK